MVQVRQPAKILESRKAPAEQAVTLLARPFPDLRVLPERQHVPHNLIRHCFKTGVQHRHDLVAQALVASRFTVAIEHEPGEKIVTRRRGPPAFGDEPVDDLVHFRNRTPEPHPLRRRNECGQLDRAEAGRRTQRMPRLDERFHQRVDERLVA